MSETTEDKKIKYFFYDDTTKLSYEQIQALIGDIKFQQYLDVVNRIKDITIELEKARDRNLYKKVERLEEELDKAKREEEYYRLVFGIAYKEFTEQLNNINMALASNKIIKMPEIYKKILIKFDILKCDKCKAIKIVGKKDILPMCINCNQPLRR